MNKNNKLTKKEAVKAAKELRDLFFQIQKNALKGNFTIKSIDVNNQVLTEYNRLLFNKPYKKGKVDYSPVMNLFDFCVTLNAVKT